MLLFRVFRRWIKKLKGDLPDNLTADIIDELETDFGHAAGFGKEQSKPALSQASKEVNRFASSKLNDIATKAGVPEFSKLSKAKSELKKQAKSKETSIPEAMFPSVKRTKKVIGERFNPFFKKF